jgi:succinate dehydrogenase hydrophobic anchor subunit
MFVYILGNISDGSIFYVALLSIDYTGREERGRTVLSIVRVVAVSLGYFLAGLWLWWCLLKTENNLRSKMAHTRNELKNVCCASAVYLQSAGGIFAAILFFPHISILLPAHNNKYFAVIQLLSIPFEKQTYHQATYLVALLPTKSIHYQSPALSSVARFAASVQFHQS